MIGTSKNSTDSKHATTSTIEIVWSIVYLYLRVLLWPTSVGGGYETLLQTLLLLQKKVVRIIAGAQYFDWWSPCI